ncbi:MAG: GNAT family N-acetyltransferase [Hahellaceae bacterium]|nr:GNAT family N-acetyltransferase [Hahellaceae bacterium]
MALRFTRITHWQTHEAQLRDIRTRVFIQEQGIPEELEWDEWDADAIHFLVLDSEGHSLATARLIYDTPTQVRMGRFAVLPPYRHQGVASGLLRYMIGFARSQGVEDVSLSAQQSVQALYAREGFECRGEPYSEAGIPHQAMILHLRDRPLRQDLTLGQDERVHRFHDIDSYRDALLTLLPQARQQIRLLTADMEPNLLDDPRLLEALSTFVRRGSSQKVRILAFDDKAPVRQGNKLLKLALRIPSSYHLRVFRPQVAFPDQVYGLVDDQGLILRHHHARWEGFVCYKDPALVQRLTDEFERWWNTAQHSLEFRQLRL